MTASRRALASDRAGVAALEFAIIAPVLLLILGGIVDFGRLLIGKGQLANGLAQTVGYVLLKGPSVAQSLIATMARDASARSGVTAGVAVAIVGPACYCRSGQPVVLTATSLPLSADYTCTGTCPGTTSPPGVYVIISTRYTFEPLMAFYSGLANIWVTQSATVRLQ